ARVASDSRRALLPEIAHRALHPVAPGLRQHLRRPALGRHALQGIRRSAVLPQSAGVLAPQPHGLRSEGARLQLSDAARAPQEIARLEPLEASTEQRLSRAAAPAG